MTDVIGFGRALTEHAERRPEKLAVALEEDRLTYAELEVGANRLARELAVRGVAPGSFVTIVLPNSVEYFELVFAIWKLGGVPLPLSPRLPARELEGLLELADPAVVVGAGGTPLEELRRAARSQDDAAHDDIANNPWKAIGTGGSTGRPKLIVDGANGPAGMAIAASLLGLQPDHVQLHVGPLYHNGPFVMGIGHVAIGGTVIMQQRFDALAWLDALERERVGWVYVVPTMLHRLFRLPPAQLEGRDLSALDMLLHTAGPCPPWLKHQTIEYFGATKVLELYGSTEGGAAGSTLIRGDEWLEHLGSVGRPIIPGTELMIGDEEGRELPQGEVGLVWVKPIGGLSSQLRGGSMKMVGEHYAVGDMGRLDEDGYLYLADRRTDMVVTGGVNVYPAEVEAVLLEHPKVADVAVVGIADEEWGQRVHAIVQPEEGVELDAETELGEFCREVLVGYKVPRSWELIAELPRDPSGKVRRSQLREERAVPTG